MPTIVTGIVRSLSSSLSRSSRGANSGRNALAIGMTKWSNSSLMSRASRGSGGTRSDSVPFETSSAPSIDSAFHTECWNR